MIAPTAPGVLHSPVLGLPHSTHLGCRRLAWVAHDQSGIGLLSPSVREWVGPPPTRRWQPKGRRCRVAVAVGIVLILGVGIAAFIVSRSNYWGGDSGGVVLRELSPIAGDVPSGSTVVYSSNRDAVWSAACADNAGGRAGWSGVMVVTNFTSVDTEPTIVDAVGKALAIQGWTPTRPIDDAAWQYTPIAEWTKAVPGTTSAKVVIYPQLGSLSPGRSAWILGAEGKTSGYALPGC